MRGGDLDAIVLTTPSAYLYGHEAVERRTSGAARGAHAVHGIHLLLLVFLLGVLLVRPFGRH
jgi:hypothetical protein